MASDTSEVKQGSSRAQTEKDRNESVICKKIEHERLKKERNISGKSITPKISLSEESPMSVETVLSIKFKVRQIKKQKPGATEINHKISLVIVPKFNQSGVTYTSKNRQVI